ncbi:hypothetical protein BJ508DRAFT_329901 [Ascobolus immersus RN42]|uniref:Restriction endonuclease domain-containing protein n=1 Tax=Ascobolus immersus RN42 TaxID=1160509 RepID=A0A3N4HXC2_ASCIM|nr:hypothetical protein BJ508DRAFT_329901 [Ascobolus immersus RN42]
MGAENSTPSDLQTSYPATSYDSRQLDIAILAASQSIKHHITYNDSLDDLRKALGDLERTDMDLLVAVHRAAPAVVDALVDGERPHRKVFYIASKKLMIVTLPGKIHTIINPWLIQFFGCHDRHIGLRGLMRIEKGTHVNSTYSTGEYLSGKGADIIVRSRSARAGPALIIEILVSEEMPDLRLDARWWLENVDGVRVVLLVGLDKCGRRIKLEKWTNITADDSTQSGITKTAVCEQWMELSWGQAESSSCNSFIVNPGSIDPLVIGSAAELLNDTLLPSSLDYTISSTELQEMVEHVNQCF